MLSLDELLAQGFDYAYDKRLYDRLVEGSARTIGEHLHADLVFMLTDQMLTDFGMFLGNPDECDTALLGHSRRFTFEATGMEAWQLDPQRILDDRARTLRLYKKLQSARTLTITTARGTDLTCDVTRADAMYPVMAIIPFYAEVALIPGLGESNWGYFGIRSVGSNMTYADNRLTNIGYIGMVASPGTRPCMDIQKMAVEEINATGGVMGRPIKYIVMDRNNTFILKENQTEFLIQMILLNSMRLKMTAH